MSATHDTAFDHSNSNANLELSTAARVHPAPAPASDSSLDMPLPVDAAIPTFRAALTADPRIQAMEHVRKMKERLQHAYLDFDRVYGPVFAITVLPAAVTCLPQQSYKLPASLIMLLVAVYIPVQMVFAFWRLRALQRMKLLPEHESLEQLHTFWGELSTRLYNDGLLQLLGNAVLFCSGVTLVAVLGVYWCNGLADRHLDFTAEFLPELANFVLTVWLFTVITLIGVAHEVSSPETHLKFSPAEMQHHSFDGCPSEEIGFDLTADGPADARFLYGTVTNIPVQDFSEARDLYVAIRFTDDGTHIWVSYQMQVFSTWSGDLYHFKIQVATPNQDAVLSHTVNAKYLLWPWQGPCRFRLHDQLPGRHIDRRMLERRGWTINIIVRG